MAVHKLYFVCTAVLFMYLGLGLGVGLGCGIRTSMCRGWICGFEAQTSTAFTDAVTIRMGAWDSDTFEDNFFRAELIG